MPRSNLERDANRACFFIPDRRGGFPLAPRHGWDSYAPPVVARIGDRGWDMGRAVPVLPLCPFVFLADGSSSGSVLEHRASSHKP